MSETWIRPNTTSANLSEITPPGYNLSQQPQEVCQGFVKDGLDPSVVPTKNLHHLSKFLHQDILTQRIFFIF